MAASIEPEQTPRLPWTATAAALLAFISLFLLVGGSFFLPIFALALLATYLTPFRLQDRSWLRWGIRIIFFTAILAVSASQTTQGSDALLDHRFVSAFGELCAAELVVQAWRQNPTGGPRGASSVLLVGLILLASCNSFDSPFVPLLAPLCIFFMALSLRDFRWRPERSERRTRLENTARRARTVAFGLAVLTGLGVHQFFHTYRTDLTTWGMRFLNEMRPQSTMGLSTSPTLAFSLGMRGSLTRMLRLENYSSDPHLRVMSFDTYFRGSWKPYMNARKPFKPASLQELRANAPGQRARVTRLQDKETLICAPLSAAGLDPGEGNDMDWSPEHGGPIRSTSEDVTGYQIILSSDEAHQGPLAIPMTPLQRQAYLAVPWRQSDGDIDISQDVLKLARQIQGKLTDPNQKIDAVVNYLTTHHHYSLFVNPGKGDQISNFLLKGLNAHCEYFASAAVILLRAMNVPSRYVIGYYAHESDGPNAVIVRGRDAHAWTECWIDGKGWVTVDATPGDGRPDEDTGPVPAIVRWKEWLQDHLQALRDRLSDLSGPQLALLISGIGGVLLLYIYLRSRRARVKSGSKAFAYFSPNPELNALALRFEDLFRRKGVPFPAQRTWQEHLATLAVHDQSETPPVDVAAARDFVQEYTAVRFRKPGDTDSIANLRALLERLGNG